VVELELIVLKIGGSVITPKTKNKLTVRRRAIRRIAEEIKKAKKIKNFSLIIVHGVGPFGHKIVKDYGMEEGIRTKKQWKGLIVVHRSIRHLNEEVAKVFEETGLLPFSINTSSFAIKKNKKIIKFDIEVVKEALKMNPDIIPLLHGDVPFDLSSKASPLSADYIAPLLSKKLNAKKMLSGGDVKGVFDSDPKINKKAKLIKKINSKNFEKILLKATGSRSTDVTGGMKGKLLQLRKMPKGTKTIIFDLTEKDNLLKLLTGKHGIGTEILFK